MRNMMQYWICQIRKNLSWIIRICMEHHFLDVRDIYVSSGRIYREINIKMNFQLLGNIKRSYSRMFLSNSSHCEPLGAPGWSFFIFIWWIFFVCENPINVWARLGSTLVIFKFFGQWLGVTLAFFLAFSSCQVAILMAPDRLHIRISC